MSLESNLELNNQLLTQHNALLELLITALATGQVTQPQTVTQVQEYRETVPDKSAAKNAPPLTLSGLSFGATVALGCLQPSGEPTPEALHQAADYEQVEGEARVVQIDAMDMALQGIPRAKALTKEVLLQLVRTMVAYWGDLTTMAARRSFAEAWIAAPANERVNVTPQKISGEGKQPEERKGPFYCKNVDGSAASELHTLRKLNAMLEKGHVEINRVEYLQLQEEFARKDAANSGQGQDAETDDTPDFAALRKQATDLIMRLAKGGYRAEAIAILGKFDAQKLGQVNDEKLPEVISLAEAALEG